jgi:gamma-glutamylcyclotransferase (GGCT)/AIG2-like uncharacterized protein YtfP
MNSVDMATNLINRAKSLQEFTVTTAVPEDFRFNGVVPFDMEIKDGEIAAKVYAVDFNEAIQRLDEFLENCK